ncbi:hypothetical protein PMAYCL1PPCAC_33522, partial [Pristionchus mayeri]
LKYVQTKILRKTVLEGFMPLILMSPGLAPVYYSTLKGEDLDDASAVVTFFLYLTPSSTALLLIRFVRQSANSRDSSRASHPKGGGSNKQVHVKPMQNPSPFCT